MLTVQDAIPVCYVRDLDAGQSFYELLGLAEQRRGGDAQGGYRYLGAGDCTVLLARVDPSPVVPPMPLAVYLWSEDVAAVQAALTAAGTPCEHVGYPEHAPGGELRTADPDGNVVVLGQRANTGSATAGRQDAGYSILQEAAARAATRGDAPAECAIGGRGGVPCPEPAAVRVADPSGTTVWGCLAHTEEALLNVRAAFIAADDDQGLAPWLASRRQPPADGS
ncbi:VOC family protein [Dactylosporangium matsuzakiense]|uniref:VOC domain-containing protein n=1 Tax=Dactylosporangium matsuzakiense TaxID=53360 RepID=A0A9W6NPQ6_9ACTN|nr:VOC family protein [Dactylosporangium matsuzakiense]GLL04573.1 hypothetical protein GCM10017581_063200 [Dactylosporangium matsuzakiense]